MAGDYAFCLILIMSPWPVRMARVTGCSFCMSNPLKSHHPKDTLK